MDKRFPRYLNSPMQVLWFEADELAVLFFFFAVALNFESWTMWGVAAAAPWIFGKLKRRYPRGALKHLFYFAGLTTPPGAPTWFEKDFCE
ncbi:MAG: type IV conjugative transfer system protein TraL [Candidatus Nitrospinota bacterium M3_3B_026]